MTYIIKDWNLHFENNRTRDIINLMWIPVPNKQDGDGYTEIMEDIKNGTAIFGCWIACLELASRCDPRGTLLRGDKTPHDMASISRITRVPIQILKIAIPKLISIGWIITSDNPAPSCDNPAPSCIEGNRIEGNRMVSKGKESKDKYLDFVFLTKIEHQSLKDQFPDIQERIERLNNYIGSKGKNYKSHYHTILAWAKNDKATTKPKICEG